MVSLDGMVPHVVDKKILNKKICRATLTACYLIFKKLKRLISRRPLLLFFLHSNFYCAYLSVYPFFYLWSNTVFVLSTALHSLHIVDSSNKLLVHISYGLLSFCSVDNKISTVVQKIDTHEKKK